MNNRRDDRTQHGSGGVRRGTPSSRPRLECLAGGSKRLLCAQDLEAISPRKGARGADVIDS